MKTNNANSLSALHASRDGDRAWRGVKMVAPHLVPKGYAATAINMRFRQGVPENRLGMTRPTGMNRVVGTGVYPWGEVHGVGVFREATTGAEYHLIAADGGVYFAQPNTTPRSVALPAGVSIDGPVEFVQGPDVMVLLDGAGTAEPLVMRSIAAGFAAPVKVDVWDVTVDVETGRVRLEDHNFAVGELVRFGGTTLPGGVTAEGLYYVLEIPGPDYFTVEDELGAEVSFSSAGSGVTVEAVDGTRAMPNGSRGLYAGNRLWVVSGDAVYASDLLDYTRYTVYNEFRILQGGADALVQIGMFGKTTMVCLRKFSVVKITGVYGDLSERAQDLVTRRYGCVAPKSACDIGTDFVWLSQEGVASLVLSEESESKAAGSGLGSAKWAMFSDDIEPLIKRIAWQWAAGAVGVFWDKRYYLAVPLDGGEVLGPELVPTGMESFGQVFKVPVAAGSTYRWVKGANEAQLVNGATVLTRGGDFVAAGSFVEIERAAVGVVTASLKQLWRGVNNAVLVYDTVNGAWSGHDEAPGIGFKDFLIRPYQGRDRLFLVTHQGWIMLYEEDFEEALAVPYAEVTMEAMPAGEDAVQVNGGTLVMADTGGAVNSGSTFGASGALADVRGNLWVDSDGAWGFYGFGDLGSWSAPNTVAVKVAGGVRFYAANGLLPVVVTTGSGWGVSYAVTQPVVGTLLTRRYVSESGELVRGRWVNIDWETWGPEIEVAVVTDGVEEVTSVTATAAGAATVTKDRTKWYRPWSKADWNESNAGDDFMQPHRKDYSVVLPAAGMELGSGVDFGLHQSSRQGCRVWGLPSLGAQVRLVCRRGRMRVNMVRVDGGEIGSYGGANG